MLELTLGYLKDFLAVFVFLILFITIYKTKNINKLKTLLLILFTIGFGIDFWFSTNPHYHNMTFSELKNSFY
tara:strand:- start:186 stop:401 length:216 start_codon:yes stop_codon:yes gene_type:complete